MNPGRHFLPLWIASAFFAACVLGQGNVNLNNNFVPPGGTRKAYILDADGLPFPKAHGRVEVLDSTGQVIRSGGLALDGIFAFGVTDIPGTTPGGNGLIVIRAWDLRFGVSFDAASFRSTAEVRLVGLGGGAIPPPPLGSAGNFTGLHLTVLSLPDLPSDVGITVATDDSMTIQCTGWYWYPYRLWSSPDLVHWAPASEFQNPGFGEITNQWYRVARWQVPRPAFNVFFRVAPYGRSPAPSVAP